MASDKEIIERLKSLGLIVKNSVSHDLTVTRNFLASFLDAPEVARNLLALMREGFGMLFFENSAMKLLKIVKILRIV